MSQPSKYRTISALRYPRPFWRYLLLFQSWSQLQSWVITVLLTLVLITGVINFFSTLPFPMAEIVVGAVLGSLVSVVMVVPAEFDVFSSPEHAVKLFRSQLEWLGYVQLSAEVQSAIYRPKVPRFLRWDEGNVVIQRHEDKVTVSGSMVALINLRRLY